MMFKLEDKDKEIINRALEEDIASGDITSEMTLDDNKLMIGEFLAKDDGIICGLYIARYIFRKLDNHTVFKSTIEDGKTVKKGDVFATVDGHVKALLEGERTALNFMQRMSGIATTTNQYIKLIGDMNCKLLDTRKTTPVLRRFEKYAVICGGGFNHRMGLYDMIIIKDNHIKANGGIKKTLEKVFKQKINVPIEIEVKNLEELKIALDYPLSRIMIDNFSFNMMKEAVKITNHRIPLEASGGINIATVNSVCKTGVDCVSCGALTHSYKSLDISFNVYEK